MDLQTEIGSNNIILLMVSKEGYRKGILDVSQFLDKNSSKVCYVCVNEPYGFVSGNLAKSGIDVKKFFFIDTLTRNVQEPPHADNCIFVSSPSALTEISLAFSKALNEMHCDASIFDTLSTMLVYEKPHAIIQFVHNLLTKLRISSGKAIFVTLKDDVNSELTKDLFMFVDKVVDMTLVN
ncbi:MAG: hypothetical protein AABX00_06225 [Nanoarchaeota archaeon]